MSAIYLAASARRMSRASSARTRRKLASSLATRHIMRDQLNENENNKNREYPEIDRHIKATYIQASTAQKTKLYDMYARFFRWASDRVDENGIVAFISNRSFIDSRTFDGFRKTVTENFNDIYIVDLGGDVRADPRLSGTKHNVFGIQTGVAISFMVKRAKAKGCRIRYTRRPQLETADEKLSFLASAAIDTISFDDIQPNAKNDSINYPKNDFETFIPIADRTTKQTKIAGQERAIFKLYSQGLKTDRDEWVCAFSRADVVERTKDLIDNFNAQQKKLQKSANRRNVDDIVEYDIKWTRKLKNQLVAGRALRFNDNCIVRSLYRPYVKNFTYYSWELNEDLYQLNSFFPNPDMENRYISFVTGTRLEFGVLAGSQLPIMRFTPSILPSL